MCIAHKSVTLKVIVNLHNLLFLKLEQNSSDRVLPFSKAIVQERLKEAPSVFTLIVLAENN